jgi:hypothetical protein
MKSSIASLSLALLIGTANVATAQDQPLQGPPPAMHGAFRQACGADMQALCSTAQTREDRRACMRANKDKLSDGCKSFLASRMEHWRGSDSAEPQTH